MYVNKSSLDFFSFSKITGTKSIEKSRKSEPNNPSDLTWELLQQQTLHFDALRKLEINSVVPTKNESNLVLLVT